MVTCPSQELTDLQAKVPEKVLQCSSKRIDSEVNLTEFVAFIPKQIEAYRRCSIGCFSVRVVNNVDLKMVERVHLHICVLDFYTTFLHKYSGLQHNNPKGGKSSTEAIQTRIFSD